MVEHMTLAVTWFWQTTSPVRTRLELPYDTWVYWQCGLLHTVFYTVDCLGKEGKECHSRIILVLEYSGKHDHVRLLDYGT